MKYSKEQVEKIIGIWMNSQPDDAEFEVPTLDVENYVERIEIISSGGNRV